MAKSNTKRFTIFDVMEAKGVFAVNSANRDSVDPVTNQPLYEGPVRYPLMMYHPNGDEEVIVQASIEITPYGPQALNEQRALRTAIANNAEEEEDLRDEGWHDQPIAAVNARRVAEGLKPLPVPKIATIDRMAALEAQLQSAQAELARVRAEQSSSQGGTPPLPEAADTAGEVIQPPVASPANPKSNVKGA